MVTGAFGQIGKRCTEILLRRGHTVVATDLHTNKAVAAADKLAAGGYPGKLVVAYADVLDADAIRQLVLTHRPRALVHLAAMCSPPSYRNPRLARQVNVGGTRNLVKAAQALPDPPLVVMASSAAVYGSRNPHRFPERITSATAVNPIDQYGEDKVLAETVIRDSGLPHAVLRLGGVISPDAARNLSRDYLVLMRATPGDNRLHTVDARDAALAFANAVDHAQAVNTTVLLIAGDDTHVHTHREVEDDMLAALGVGRLGASASLPGDPGDDRGWSFTGWFDTTEAQRLLQFQQHDWPATVAWIAESHARLRPVLRATGPLIRPALRLVLAVQRRIERRGRFADPWALIEKKYGPGVLARPRREPPDSFESE
ncbi:NAD-dependent epimerase/dehydratase family protein [Mycobacterium botniense]|uniref:Oxidoreductase n=1 Tax=Mycobacterium botniense TaxID=84962 RepID=A0A7I9XW83_9MYCO|nr:NAD(P)-dependent oxidoreductase [Mycobacterium botniense]GFG74050.1 oxidoreductase [Mycobacterium botniense]